MRILILTGLLAFASLRPAFCKVVVFWQDGFPTVESQPVARTSLEKALAGLSPQFATLEDLKKPEALKDVDLLVLPYGSAVPADAWVSIQAYLRDGGSLLTLGGRPLFVPVREHNGEFVQEPASSRYASLLGFLHTYVAPQKDATRFAWDDGYDFLGKTEVRARRVFVVAAGWGVASDRRGLGFFVNSRGERISAPVVRQDFTSSHAPMMALFGARGVYLDFDPEPGFWDSDAGTALIRQAADYARHGATLFSLEMLNATVAEGETPQVRVLLRNVRRQRRGDPQEGGVELQLLSGNRVLATKQVECSGDTTDVEAPFQNSLSPGLYTVRGVYRVEGKPQEFYATGFWVRDEKLLKSGATLGVGRTYFTLDGAPFLPFGTNYFTTDPYDQGFIGPGNAYVWDRDFAEMEEHGVTFIRTGIWNDHFKFLDRTTGAADERFLRNLEGFLLSAVRHHIQVHFTFFAFDPQTLVRHPGEDSLLLGPGTNPYTDPVALRAQQNYVLSVVQRFKEVPSLSWDLINEPSFSNPKRLWRGNTPNNDPTEAAAWHEWLAERYETVARLAEAWGVTPESLGSFENVPLPEVEELGHTRYGNAREARAFDYNLFAQDMFARWVKDMTEAIHSTGSRQLVVVGQDEGGVTDRVLSQFFGVAGVAFTVNHTYWRDDALLWDSLAAKRPGMPNLIGETGYQPVWNLDGSWRLDELTGFGLLERKMALGFAAANSGSLQWAWELGDVFGVKRGDGSNKIWEDMFRDMGKFAREAAPYATDAQEPDVAIVLPQSLQLSVLNGTALEAQQKCVRALYHYARASAYAVGEYQTELVGNPRLIILPSPWALNQKAWEAVLEKVRAGTTLLVSGRFDLDEHFHSLPRPREIGMDYAAGPLMTREIPITAPGDPAHTLRLTYGGERTTFLDRAFLPSGETFVEKTFGKGRILFVPLPLELNDNLEAVGEVYRYALRVANVAPLYTADLKDPGILICPTRLPHATLYVLTSESSATSVRFRDAASGKDFAGKLDPGRAALLLVGEKGEILASYNWPGGN